MCYGLKIGSGFKISSLRFQVEVFGGRTRAYAGGIGRPRDEYTRTLVQESY